MDQEVWIVKELANVTARQVELRLQKITPDIQSTYKQAQDAAILTVQYALTCGRKLCEAKRLVGYGSFERYIVETCQCDPRTARRYMCLAENWEELQQSIGEEGTANLTVTDGLAAIKKHLSQPKKITPPKVRNRTELSELPLSGDEDLTPEEAEVCDVGEYEEAVQRGDSEEDSSASVAGYGSNGHDSKDVRGAGLYRNGDSDAGTGDRQPLPNAYDLCLQCQRAIDTLQGLLDQLHETHPHLELYARISGREDENSKDLARWSRAANDRSA